MLLRRIGSQIVTYGLGIRRKVARTSGVLFGFMREMILRYQAPNNGATVSCEGVEAKTSVGDPTARGVRNLSDDEALAILLIM